MKQRAALFSSLPLQLLIVAVHCQIQVRLAFKGIVYRNPLETQWYDLEGPDMESFLDAVDRANLAAGSSDPVES